MSQGTWSPSPTSVTYAWHRCNANGRICMPIQGANASVYPVTPLDSGHTLNALVTAKSAGGTQAAFSTTVVVP